MTDIGTLHAGSVFLEGGDVYLGLKGTDGGCRVRVPERMVEPFMDTAREVERAHDGDTDGTLVGGEP